MLTAFSTALSALNAQSTAINITGNNLANLNTTGYKANTTQFYDLVSQQIGNAQVGLGVGQPMSRRVFSQGAIQGSTGGLDVAISGSGFLIVKDGSGNNLYTRAGNLQKDANGNLTDASGAAVQGWSATNGVVNTSAPIGNLTIPIGSVKPPQATSNLSLSANLDSRSSVVASGSQTTANVSFSQGVQVFDSLGNKHDATINYWNNGSNNWGWQVNIPGADVGLTAPSGSTTIPDKTIGSGTLKFDSSGKLITSLTTPTVMTATGLVDGAADLKINFNLTNDGKTPVLTQFGQASATSGNQQDGYSAGQFTDATIGNDGLIQANYSNGQHLTVGQLAVANFVNPETLLAVGNNAYQITGATSNAAIGTSGTGGRGTIQGSSLESSTVDIATEFTDLMIHQRSYQASSKVITTADQINQDTINLIR